MNLNELHSADKKVSSISLFKDGTGTANAIHIQANEILKEHVSKIPALLLCVSGKVIYQDESNNKMTLQSGDYQNITPDVKHWLQAETESQLVLIK